jgi:hypothetical protein
VFSARATERHCVCFGVDSMLSVCTRGHGAFVEPDSQPGLAMHLSCQNPSERDNSGLAPFPKAWHAGPFREYRRACWLLSESRAGASWTAT